MPRVPSPKRFFKFMCFAHNNENYNVPNALNNKIDLYYGRKRKPYIKR